jgi:hypothetical protein
LGIGLIVGGLGLLLTAVAGLGRRYRLLDRRRRRRVRRSPPVRPQRTERPAARRDAGRRNANLGNASLGNANLGNANPGRANPALRPRVGDPRLRGNERPRPIVDPRRFPPSQSSPIQSPPIQSSPIQSATPARRVPIQPDSAVDTLLLHPVPAWSQPAPAIRRDPPRNDPPRTDLITAPVAPITAAAASTVAAPNTTAAASTMAAATTMPAPNTAAGATAGGAGGVVEPETEVLIATEAERGAD